MRIAIIGASGYAGLELVRIVLRHPRLELAVVTSEQRAGQPLGEAFPALRDVVDLSLESADPAKIAGRADAAFMCLPHGTAAPMVAALRKAGVVVVDISAEFRLRRMEDYETWYGTHGAPELFGQGVYGLPEVYADELAGAELVAAPGCYPTSALLPMLPLLRADFVGAAPVVVDAKSGVSGAGRTLDEGFLFAELDENARAYKVAMHRHGVEIEQEASRAAGRAVGVTFVPHLIPTIRGIVAACYLQPTRSVELAEAHALLAEAYADAPFVRVLPPGDSPALASVRGSNYCDVAVHVDERNGTLVALAAIDNLVKGAGGQGIQCLNLTQGWDEREGLAEAPLAP